MSSTDHLLNQKQNQSKNAFSRNQNFRCNNHSIISGNSFDWLLVSLSKRITPLFVIAIIAVAIVCCASLLVIQSWKITG